MAGERPKMHPGFYLFTSFARWSSEASIDDIHFQLERYPDPWLSFSFQYVQIVAFYVDQCLSLSVNSKWTEWKHTVEVPVQQATTLSPQAWSRGSCRGPSTVKLLAKQRCMCCIVSQDSGEQSPPFRPCNILPSPISPRELPRAFVSLLQHEITCPFPQCALTTAEGIVVVVSRETVE